MTKIFRLICVWVWLPLLASCSDFLDITPDGQVKKDEMLSTNEGVEDALYGVYSQLRLDELYGQELSFSTMEVLAQYLSCYGNDGVTAMSNFRYDDTRVKGVFESVWTQMYKNISNVNAVINCDLVKGATSYPASIYRGEALGLRAFMHFDLLRLFTEQITLNPSAKGIPYATEFSLNTPEFLSAAKVYELIEADLLEAERLLADEEEYEGVSDFMTDRQIHFNLHAVRATLARVFLTKGDKANALNYATKVINESGYSLSEKTEVNGDLAGILSTKETIFGVYYGTFFSKVDPKLQKTITFNSLDPRDDIEDFYTKKIVGTDFRYTAYLTPVDGGTGDKIKYRLSKLTDPYELNGIAANRPADKILGINMIRMPEMYYIAAECLLESNYDEAVRLFNEVLAHRGLLPLDQWPAPQDVLTMESINDERYREFIGEGQTFFNLKRQNLPLYKLTAEGELPIYPSNKIYVIPIPDIENDYRN